tara:strand:- start:475 stop:1650 length:1176 start_codon:yes stop_codon:yes gene_type:complete
MKCWVINKSKAKEILNNNSKNVIPSDVMFLAHDIKLPEISEDEALIKVNSAGLNFNSVWSAKCHPVDPFSLVNGHVRRNKADKKHIQDYFIPGSDASGTIVKIGLNKKFKEGDEVVIHCAVINGKDLNMEDPMLSKTQSVWGYETNFGSFSEFSIVKISQLLKKPKNLHYTLSGSYMLTLGTAYRMIVTKNGGKLNKGETCLIWGASGGLGVFAIQLVNSLGAIPICIVSTKEKADYCKKFGAKHFIILNELENKKFLVEDKFNMKMWLEFSSKIKNIVGSDKVDMVFEHVGMETIALGIYLLRRGGRVVTCAASSGYEAKIDIRYIWMEMKKIIGSHFCNINEAEEANDLITNGLIKHEPNKIIDFNDIPKGLDEMNSRKSLGKIAVKIN